jgi:hypothetical protein
MRYEDANENLTEVFLNVAEERFPNTCANLNIKLMFDTKRRVSRGKLVLASVEVASEKVKYFTKHEVKLGSTVDYVLTVDSKAWEIASAEDKKRLISHELRHVFVDEKDGRKLLPHDIEDFVAEVALNTDNPNWAGNLAQVVSDVYEQEKELKKLNKGEV